MEWHTLETAKSSSKKALLFLLLLLPLNYFDCHCRNHLDWRTAENPRHDRAVLVFSSRSTLHSMRLKWAQNHSDCLHVAPVCLRKNYFGYNPRCSGHWQVARFGVGVRAWNAAVSAAPGTQTARFSFSYCSRKAVLIALSRLQVQRTSEKKKAKKELQNRLRIRYRAHMLPKITLTTPPCHRWLFVCFLRRYHLFAFLRNFRDFFAARCSLALALLCICN